MDIKSELEFVEQFANQLSLSRVKTEGLFFDKDFVRQETDGKMQLVSTKAVVVTHGKTTKVRIGEGEKYATYEDAVAAVKKHWSEYFKARRLKDKTDATVAGARRRQKRYYDTKKARATELDRQQ